MGIRNEALKMALEQSETLNKLGQIYSLKVDPKINSILLEILLKGESLPFLFEAKYQIITESGKTIAQIQNIHCNKDWINEVIKLWIQKNGPIKQEIKGFFASRLAKLFL